MSESKEPKPENDPKLDLFQEASLAPTARTQNPDWLERLQLTNPKLGQQAETIILQWWAGDKRWHEKWRSKRALGRWLREKLELDVQLNQVCVVIDRLRPQ